MKRSGPLKRRTPLKADPAKTREWQRRSAPMASGTPMRSRSKAKAREMATRSAETVAAIAAGQRCELGHLTTSADPAHRCAGTPGGRHEIRKRSSGGSVTKPANLRWACNPCNGWVEDHPADAHALGLVARPGDPDWEALAR